MSNGLPDVTFSILDGQLGQVPGSVANASVKLGICSDGTVGSIYSFGDTSTLSTLGVGPLVEALGDTLSVAGGVQYGLPLNPTTSGAASSVDTSKVTGAGVVAVTVAPKTSIAIKITTGGALATAFIAFSVNGGAYSTPIVTVAGPGSYAVPGTLTTVTLAAGTYVLNDVYTISTLGAVTLSGSGPASSNVTFTASPMDVYAVQVTIVTGGGVGTATFTYSVDGGNTVSSTIATAAKYAIPGTGVVLGFTSTFTAADVYSFTTTAAAFNNTDVTNGLTTLLASAIGFGFVHLVGVGTNAAAAAATAAVVDTAMTTAETAYRFIFTIMGCPTAAESDATVAAAFTSFASKRVAVCAGDVKMISALTGRIERRDCSWVVSSRAAAVNPGEDVAWVGSPKGSIPHIDASNGAGLYRDEAKTPLLDAARFCTMRTFPGLAGYYITNGRMMAAGGSDFTYMVNRRVMDAACTIARSAELPYLNGRLRVNSDGTIDERDASSFEKSVTAQIKAVLMGSSPPQISNASVSVNRSANILSTGIEPVSIRITPLGYGRQIATTIGFNNPALLAA